MQKSALTIGGLFIFLTATLTIKKGLAFAIKADLRVVCLGSMVVLVLVIPINILRAIATRDLKSLYLWRIIVLLLAFVSSCSIGYFYYGETLLQFIF